MIKALFISLISIVPITLYGQEVDTATIYFESIQLDSQFTAIKYRPLNPAYHIFPIEEKDSVHGIPDTLSSVTVLHQFFDSNQYFYQSYRSGHISGELYTELSEDIDSTELTTEWIDLIMSVLVGKDFQSRPFVIVDRNNNEDFSDEKIIYLSKYQREQGQLASRVLRATTDVSFNYYGSYEV